MLSSRMHRHLQVLEDSKQEKYIKNKRTNLLKIINEAKNFDAAYDADLYAISCGYKPPNILYDKIK